MATPSSNRRLGRVAFVVSLLLFFALAVDTALVKSPTNDEPVHLMRGAALSQSGDLSLQYEHTPLSHRLIGLLLPSEPTLPRVDALEARPTNDRTAIAAELLWQSSLNVDRALFLARLPIIWVGLLLGAALALWTAAATRHAAAVAVVMGFYATGPNLLASAALATTDFTAAATFFGTVCAWWFYWQRPTRRRWLITGVLLGLGLAAKLTGVLLIPVLFVLAYVYPRRERWWRPGALALGLLPVAGLVLWAIYLFQIGPWQGMTVPAPAYWESWASVLTHVSEGHPAFFLGRVSSDGWLLYFPVSLLIKTPLAAIVLFMVALVLLARARAWRTAAFALVPIAAVLGAAMVSRLNIGFRHILPAIPFMLLTIGLGVPGIWARRVGRWALGAVAVWVVVSAIWVHPHHLAYFNELVGGPDQGYRFLGDSNIDWGQDLKGLGEYKQSVSGPFYVSYGGTGDPAYYGLNESPLAGLEGAGSPDFHPANPAAGHYAISAGHWQGLLPEADLFDWFRRREPDGTIGYSILLYDVEQPQPGEWIAQCNAPAPVLDPAAAEQLVGVTGARHLLFNCDSAWVFPQDGAPGWYILPHRDEPWWVAGLPGVGKAPNLVYHHRANSFAPDYEVYYWPGAADPAGLLGAPPAEALLSGGPAELRGYQAAANVWHSLWRVATPSAEPLSIKAHLYAGGGPPQVADGLGFTADQWLPGDWFVQRHVFAAPGESLETGLYNYLTLENAGPSIRLPAPEPAD